MKDAYKPVWVILFVATGLVAMLGLAKLRGGGDGGPERVAWQTDLAAARERSGRENKPVVLYFTAKWCGPCQTMKSTTWADERVARLLAERYLPVKVDLDDQPAVADAFGVNGIPRVDLLRPDGTRRELTTGLTTADEFLDQLARAETR